MSTEQGVREALLDDSEATLRQVKGVLSDFAGHGADSSQGVGGNGIDLADPPEGLEDLVKMLVTTYSEIMEVIEALRQSRGLLEEQSMERLQQTHGKLVEVSSATEVAATGIMDGIDRALTLVDELEPDAEESESDGAEAREQLRQELHQIMDLLQFQDITSQQLGYASSVLFDIEKRIVQVSELFNSRIGLAGLELSSDAAAQELSETCDPNASTLDAEERQALADEIFTTPDGS